jgi:hypothetical protein
VIGFAAERLMELQACHVTARKPRYGLLNETAIEISTGKHELEPAGFAFRSYT